MTDHDRQDTDRLLSALVETFPQYLSGRLGELGLVASPTVETAIASGAEQLAASLGSLFALPAAEQTYSPLELVREATHPVTAALRRMGLSMADRDSWHEQEQPNDPYGLYPASSRDLGEEAWQLHVQWGLDKARVVAGVVPRSGEVTPRSPAVALFGVPPEERDPLAGAVRERGYRVLIWRNPAALEQAATERPQLAIVDLRHATAHDAIRTLERTGIRTIAIGAGVDDLTVPGVMALGAEEVVESARIVARLDRLLDRIV